MSKTGSLPAAFVLLFLLLCLGRVPAQTCPTPAQDVHQDWPVYNGGPEGDHYSALSQINQGNVAHLRTAWTYDAEEEGGLETNPVIVGRTLFAYTATQKVIALDAATGKLLWKFDSGVRSRQPVRGVAYWTDGREARVLASVMNFLYALDARTGKPIPTFGEQGRVDLRKGLRGEYELQSVAVTSPGLVYKDLIVLGGRNPETYPSPPGDIRAFDVRTGALRWQFHTIPHPGEFGYATWPREAWKTGGAANNWAGMVLDRERGIVYAPTGSAVFDFYGADRVGDNLFANSLLALDAATGKRLWHFQGVHHDLWDRDFPSPPVLLTVRHAGKCVDAVAQTSKQGYLFLFDRTNGKPLFPIEERKVPRSDVPGEVTSPTQPVPVLPKPFTRQILTRDQLTARTPEAHAAAEKDFETFRSGGQFFPVALHQETVVFPCFLGGAEWGGPAVDPARGILYVNANEAACVIALAENRPAGSLGERIYQNQCSLCHGKDRSGSPPTYPSLSGIGVRLSQAQLEHTISLGVGRMPAFPNLTGAHLDALAEFLRAPELQPEAAAAAPTGASSPAGEGGAALYRARCAGCHGDQREGRPSIAPALTGVGQHLTAAQVAGIVQHGNGRMPAFPDLAGPPLDELVRHVLSQSASGIADPDRGAIYSSAADGTTLRYQVTGSKDFLDPEGYPAIAPPWGTLSAIDLNSGTYLWQIPLGEYPELRSQGLPVTGTENYGGPILTAGNLLFIGATVYDRKFRALDPATGRLLWETVLPFAAVATPATYSVDGKQFIVIASGGGKDPKAPSGSSYIAFALP